MPPRAAYKRPLQWTKMAFALALDRGSQLVSIDKKPVAQLPLETVRDSLEGPAGSVVVLELQTALGPRTVPLRRKALFLPSVAYSMKPDGIGYLHDWRSKNYATLLEWVNPAHGSRVASSRTGFEKAPPSVTGSAR